MTLFTELWVHSNYALPSEEGVYLIATQSMGVWRHRLMRVFRGKKSGNLYCDILGIHKRHKLKKTFDFFWIKIEGPGEGDFTFGGEWHQ